MTVATVSFLVLLAMQLGRRDSVGVDTASRGALGDGEVISLFWLAC